MFKRIAIYIIIISSVSFCCTAAAGAGSVYEKGRIYTSVGVTSVGMMYGGGLNLPIIWPSAHISYGLSDDILIVAEPLIFGYQNNNGNGVLMLSAILQVEYHQPLIGMFGIYGGAGFNLNGLPAGVQSGGGSAFEYEAGIEFNKYLRIGYKNIGNVGTGVLIEGGLIF